MTDEKVVPSADEIFQPGDHDTIFALAISAMNIHMGSVARNKGLIASSMMKMNVILQRAPLGFVERFIKVKDKIVAQSMSAPKLSIEMAAKIHALKMSMPVKCEASDMINADELESPVEQ